MHQSSRRLNHHGSNSTPPAAGSRRPPSPAAAAPGRGPHPPAPHRPCHRHLRPHLRRPLLWCQPAARPLL